MIMLASLRSEEWTAWPEHVVEFIGICNRTMLAIAKPPGARTVAYNVQILRRLVRGYDMAAIAVELSKYTIESLRDWSDVYTDPVERRAMAQAVWHAAHDNDRPGATASAAFQAFQPEVLAQLAAPQGQ